MIFPKLIHDLTIKLVIAQVARIRKMINLRNVIAIARLSFPLVIEEFELNRGIGSIHTITPNSSTYYVLGTRRGQFTQWCSRPPSQTS